MSNHTPSNEDFITVSMSRRDKERQDACVNAMEGIEDPAGFVTAARRLIATYSRQPHLLGNGVAQQVLQELMRAEGAS